MAEEDDEYDDTENENTDSLVTSGGMKDRPYPAISKEEDKIVDAWWDIYNNKLKKPDEIKKHIEDFLAAYPHLAENLELEHEVLFEMGGDYGKEGRVEVYIDFLVKLRKDFPGVYSRSAGFFDFDIIAWLVANKRKTEIGNYLNYYTDYPVEFVDQLFKTVDLLIATDTVELVPEFASKVCREIVESPDLFGGNKILIPLVSHQLAKYTALENSEAFAEAFMNELEKIIPYKIEDAGKAMQFWKQKFENINRPFVQWPTDIPKKKSELSERYAAMCGNFTRYLHERTGISWIAAEHYKGLMQSYFAEIMDETKGKLKKQFDFSKNIVDKTIGGLCGSFVFFNACKALSLLNAIYYFACYLHACGNISDIQRSIIESDCRKLYNEMYPALTKEYTEALCFSDFPLWNLGN